MIFWVIKYKDLYISSYGEEYADIAFTSNIYEALKMKYNRIQPLLDDIYSGATYYKGSTFQPDSNFEIKKIRVDITILD